MKVGIHATLNWDELRLRLNILQNAFSVPSQQIRSPYNLEWPVLFSVNER